MLKNYLKIALRNILKNKVHSFINLFGLAIGLTIAILIFLDVQNEFSSDSFNKNGDRIYRVVQNLYGLNIPRITNFCRDKIISDIPEIKASTRYFEEDGTIKIDQNIFLEKISFVDSSFLEMFTYPLIIGNGSIILSDKKSIIITEKIANKYFHNNNPLGKSLAIKYGNEIHHFIIGGIAKDPPQNSSIKFSVLIPFENCMNSKEMKISNEVEMGTINSPLFFIELAKSGQKESVELKINNDYKKYYVHRTMKSLTFFLQPLAMVHFSNDFKFNMLPASNIINTYILILLTLLTIFIVSTNYINLSIAHSSHRFKEIGMRKIMGSSRKNLVFQFLAESIILTLSALLLAIVISELFLPTFNKIIGEKLHFNYLFTSGNILSIFFIALIVGIIAGAYPAIYLSKLNPSKILKGEQKIGGANLFTKILIISQFIFSIILIVSAIIISRQNSFMMGKNIGLNYKNIMILKSHQKEDLSVLQKLKFETSKLERIKSATITNNLIFKKSLSICPFSYNENKRFVSVFQVDYDYLKTLGLKLSRGRWFSKELPGNYKKEVIVNKSFIEAFHIKKPIGKVIEQNTIPMYNKTIIGVINDFNYLNLREKIKPVVLTLNQERSPYYLYLKFSSKITKGDIIFLNKVLKNTAGFNSFDRFFLGSFIKAQYISERRWNNIVKYLSIITIIIACLGLFGLVNYSTEKRTKEIGIRKVMGASTIDILKLILKELVLLISISLIIAFPLAFYFMKSWLNNFAYKINIGWEIFALAVLMVFVLTSITVSYQSIKTALSNPVESLRNE